MLCTLLQKCTVHNETVIDWYQGHSPQNFGGGLPFWGFCIEFYHIFLQFQTFKTVKHLFGEFEPIKLPLKCAHNWYWCLLGCMEKLLMSLQLYVNIRFSTHAKSRSTFQVRAIVLFLLCPFVNFWDKCIWTFNIDGMIRMWDKDWPSTIIYPNMPRLRQHNY